MDSQLQTFLELSTLPALAKLAGDERAAWIWSADGARILWANAAGAAFFSVRDVSGLSKLSSLARSPARPHIARIATSGMTDRMSIDRLRFYRGLRVLLLTCQCQRLILPSGHDAALIICGDKGLALTEPAFPAFLHLLAGNSRSVFAYGENGELTAQTGELNTEPKLSTTNQEQALSFGPIQFGDDWHDAAVVQLDASHNLILGENTVLEVPPEPEPVAEPETSVAQPEAPEEPGEPESLWVRAQDIFDSEADDETDRDASNEPVQAETHEAEPEVPTKTEEPEADHPAFKFAARRRPVRFAWQMDIDQRFTFLSDEFSDTLGPAAADIVGKTWVEVAEAFDIDENGKIAKALNRRDTWSGKTIHWPVSGEALRVPVDMAALPAFNRNREFEGYRGFGVCRTADVLDDPQGPRLPVESLAAAPATEPEEVHEPEVEVAVEAEIEAEESLAGIIPAVEPEETATVEQETAEILPTETVEVPEEIIPASDTEALAGDSLLGVSAAAIVDGLIPRAGHLEPAETEDLNETPSDEGSQDEVPEEPAAEEITLRSDMPETEEPAELEAEPEEITDTVEETSEDALEEEAALPFAETEVAKPTASEADTEEETEPAGISGSAPLQPAEIESAVKTLAKSFGKKQHTPVKASPETEGDFAPEGTVPPEAEATASSDTPAQQEDATSVEPAAPNEAEIEADEREFFDETAAYKDVEQEHNADQDDTAGVSNHLNLVSDDKAPGDEGKHPATIPSDTDGDGKVIRLAGRRPQLVPVDTSQLSRPERIAFRKIAEALGARLEGEFDEEDNQNDLSAEAEEALRIEREAGPIDPRLLDRLPIGIAIVHDREVLYANDTLLDLLGYRDLNALCEAGGLEALFVEDTDENLPDAEGIEGTVDDMLKVRRASGGVCAVDARMHSVPWEGGRGLMISIIERPVTRKETGPQPVATETTDRDLKQAQEQISELDAILETATDGVLVLNAHGTITKANRSAEALFGASRVDIEEAPLTDYLAPESHRSALDYLDGLARNGVASVLNDGREVLGRVTGGGLIPLFMTIGRVSSGDGEPKFCAVLRDITHWKKAEEELTQAKRQAENASSQKSDFLAKISHEIRTPLNAIIGFSEVMIEERFGTIGNDRYTEYLKDIRTSGSHIMSLINDLLDLSKIEAGKLDLRFSAVSPNEVINECVALMQPQANRERVIIRASLSEAVPSIVADHRSMRQIVLNLLSNAIKFNKSGGQVIVSTSLEDSGEVVLRVRDTGTGMSAKDLAAALEPFRQVHTARHGGGTGLGLPLTKALVEANRANFQIDSTPGQGTLVEITFPPQRVLAE